jgi:PTH1 family peptidyl-tRNA hydrolase
MFLDYLSFSKELQWQTKFKAEYAQHTISGRTCRLLKPLTFMNKSGESVAAALAFYKVDIEHVVIIHDDIELDFGSFGYKKGGGLAGHNGLRSIAKSIGTREFSRFRLGIGRPARGSVSSYVLSTFETAESVELPYVLNNAATEFERGIREWS